METRKSKHKPMTLNRFKILMAVGLMILMATPAAWAAGTPSGTPINNTATIDYEVLGANQPDITSTLATFLVDNRVDLTVASLGNTSVAASQTNAALAFTVTNVGNTTQGYLLTAVNAVANIPMDTPVSIYIEEGTTGGFQIGEDTPYTAGNNAGDLDPNGGIDQMTVYIVADAPAGATTGNIDTWWLRATTTNAGSITVTPNHSGVGDLPGTVQNVHADGDAGGGGDANRDGQHAAGGDFIVVAADLTVNKSHTVVSDPINLGVNPKAIPGAVIEYTVRVSNGTGAAQATDIVVTDDLAALVTGATPLMAFEPDTYGGAGSGLGMRMRIFTGGSWGAWTNLTIGNDADAGDWNATAGNTVTVDCGDLDADEQAEVQYQLTVQ